jgi:hypothetical protein
LVEVVIAGVDVEAVADLLQTLAELTLTPSYEFYLFKSARDTISRDFASNATRRDTVSSNARSL